MPASTILKLIAISALSISLGLVVKNHAYEGPNNDLQPIVRSCSPPLRPKLDTDLGEWEAWNAFMCLITRFFRLLFVDRVGLGLTTLIFSIMSPLLLFQLFEAGKPGRSFLLGPWTAFFDAQLGQLVGFGIATPTVWIPLYALGTLLQKKPRQALPPPSKTYTLVAGACAGLGGLSTIVTMALPLQHHWWDAANVVFQVYPLFFLPTFAFALFPPSPPAKSDRDRDRAFLASLYEKTALFSLLLHYLGVSLTLYGLVYEKTKLTDAAWLILFDNVGVLLSLVCLLAIHVSVEKLDLAEVANIAAAAVTYGPGWAFAKYLQHREEDAERRRSAGDKAIKSQ